MRLVMIASAKGGSGRTTACVRLAQALSKRHMPSGIVDFSPYPTARFLLGESATIPIVNGRSATTDVAASSMVRPFETSHECLLMDTVRLDDPLLRLWLPMVSALIVTTRMEKNSVNALPGVYTQLEELRRENPRIQFLGFLPVFTGPSDAPMINRLRASMREYILPGEVPSDERERLGPELLQTLDPVWDSLASHLAAKVELKERRPPTPAPEPGLLSRLWRTAAGMFKPQVAVAK